MAIKDLLARFKRVFTVKDWKREAQDAMRKREFVVASLDELHRIEREERENGGQDRQRTQQPPTRSPQQSAPSYRPPQKAYAEASLKELMDSVRQQQNKQ